MRSASESDWFPNRLDLRGAQRKDRRWAAIGFNMMFLFAAFEQGWLGSGPFSEVGGVVCLVAGGVAALGFGNVKYGETARRKGLEAIGKRLGFSGCIVECRYFNGDFELGRDVGLLGRDGFALRFEGMRTRFSIGREDLAKIHDARRFKPKLFVNARGHLIRVEVSPKDSEPEESQILVNILSGWPSTDQPHPSHRFPPTTPEPRTTHWFIDRSLEKAGPALLFVWLLFFLARNLFMPKADLPLIAPLLLGIASVVVLVRGYLSIRRHDAASMALYRDADGSEGDSKTMVEAARPEERVHA